MTCATRSIAGWVLAAALASPPVVRNNSNNPSGLQPPTGLLPLQTGPTSAHLAWTAASGATGYLVQRATPIIRPRLLFGRWSGGILTFDQAASIRRVAGLGDRYQRIQRPGQLASSGAGVLRADHRQRTLSADTVYTLATVVQVEPLTIPAGTTIVGIPRSQEARCGFCGSQDRAGPRPTPCHLGRSPGNRKPGDWAASSSSGTA
jgi:hypothetical protein